MRIAPNVGVVDPGATSDCSVTRNRFSVERPAAYCAHDRWLAIARNEGAHGVKNLNLLVANRIRCKGARRLHCGEREQLQQVVLEHVPQHARFLVILAASFHSDGFRGRDLNVRDVVPVPQWLEDRVRKAEDEDVLDAFFAEIVIDAINLVLSNSSSLAG
jgi:hypothetical protein